MNYKPLRNLPLKHYLERPMHESYKKAIQDKLTLVFSFPRTPDSDPIDLYRYHGQQVIRLEIICELNTLIMNACTPYSYLRPWARELFELKENCEELIKTTKLMIRAMISNKDITGFIPASEYSSDKEPPSTDIV